MLLREKGAYWTFIVHTGERTLVGASPERHISVRDGLAVMNPISGTYRYPPAGPNLAEVMEFLDNRKEADELYMVVDEELKMMARICEDGGRVLGPYLKEMAHLAHTEYFIEGQTSRDVREVLRETLFAPTVTGSPLESACRVIRRYEPQGRGYYSGVAAHAGLGDPDPHRRDRGRRPPAHRRRLDHRASLRSPGRDLSGERMQRMAREMNLSESTFVLRPQQDGDARIRIFTPVNELPFAGHPLLGTAIALGAETDKDRLFLETRMGTVPFALERQDGKVVACSMQQPIPTWEHFSRPAELLAALGLKGSTFPIEVYRNGPPPRCPRCTPTTARCATSRTWR